MSSNDDGRDSTERESPEATGAGPTPARGHVAAWALTAGALVVAALAIGFALGRGRVDSTPSSTHGTTDDPAPATPGSRLARVAGDLRGVTVTPSDGRAVGGEAGAAIPAGAVVATGAASTAEIELDIGVSVAMSEGSELRVPASDARLRFRRGAAVFDVGPRRNGEPAVTVDTAGGSIEVLGTKFVIEARDRASVVRVLRGSVRVQEEGKNATRVVAQGTEATLGEGSRDVTRTAEVARTLTWLDDESDPADTADDTPGLGELRARKPGEREDRERPLVLASHTVDARIVGPVAYTEIEETFRNDSSDVLEGIYRFPLPPHARIAKLSLLVDGRWEEGAFVERDHAKKIWRGVIRNATPVAQRQVREEYVWVPGPWRDPALLEWQNGGRFELRIYPIPAHGTRAIRIAYTETLAPHGGSRRYVYPLPRSSDGSTRIERFRAEAQISTDANGEVSVQPYEARVSRDGTTARVSFERTAFEPSGDLVIDAAHPGGEAELRYYAYRGEAAVPPAESSREGAPEVVLAQRSLANDQRPYVVFALRPTFPAATTSHARDVIVVVDSSRSMTGSRRERAAGVVSRFVRELDSRDRVRIVTCDHACAAAEWETPSRDLAARLRADLLAKEPAGASNLVAAVEYALGLVEGRRDDDGTRETHVYYVGDGHATVGPRSSATIDAAIREAVRLRDDVRVSAVGIGSDVDDLALETVARAGGGRALRFVPGSSAAETAIAMLETLVSTPLEQVAIELPPGVEDIAPAALPSLAPGEEILVAARLARSSLLRGEVVLRAVLDGRPFERRYPVEIEPSTSRGNAFAAKVWAEKSIERLELDGGADVDRIVALSKGYGVMSKRTSLLVLESEAMFRAFGVDRARAAVDWTGEGDVEFGESGDALDALGVGAVADRAAAGAGADLSLGSVANAATLSGRGSGASASGWGTSGGPGTTGAGGARSDDAEASRSRERRARPETAAAEAEAPARAAPRPAASAQPSAEPAEDERANFVLPSPKRLPSTAPPVPPRGQWMRREWYRAGVVERDRAMSGAESRAVEIALRALAEKPDSRDRHRTLVRALSRAGDLSQAKRAALAWLERDALDAEALTYLSDVEGRSGDREAALRTLAGVVDLEPNEEKLHERLANAFDRLERRDEACAHRVALAEMAPKDVARVSDALACASAALSEPLMRELSTTDRDRALASSRRILPSRPREELSLDAAWSGDADLDLALITPEGTRLSLLGGRTTVSASDVTSRRREHLGLTRAALGSYVIEIVRVRADDEASRHDREPIRGTIEVRVVDERRTLTFALVDERAVVGRARVERRSRLVPQ